VHWADLLAGLSSCRELEAAMLSRVDVEPLFPPSTVFGRLTHLEISDYEREHPPSAGKVGLWELMASGGLPTLAKLSVWLKGRWLGVEEVRSRVAPALEAVAGTLTHIGLGKGYHLPRHEDFEMVYELGVAVGELRLLEDLVLELIRDGRIYHAFAEGLAASGGERVLPLLYRVKLATRIKASHDKVVSLLLPSVRVFELCYPVTLTACTLRQAGYKGLSPLLREDGVRGGGCHSRAACLRLSSASLRRWNVESKDNGAT
jgi:hypothetical protein